MNQRPPRRHRSACVYALRGLLAILLSCSTMGFAQAPVAAVSPPSVEAIQPAKSSSAFRVVPADDKDSDAINAIVEQGRAMEEKGQWIEALSHYDKAYREYTDSDLLRQRRTLAHIHVDLDRRALDQSFLTFAATSTKAQAISTLEEICSKIQLNYVHDPNWQRVAWRGTASLDVAVTKPAFRQRFCPNVSDEKIREFRYSLRSNVNRRPVRTRSEVPTLASYAAELAKAELGVPEAASVAEYCTGAVAALDTYSSFLTQSQLGDVYNQIDGNFVGLGVELKATQSTLKIVKVIPGGPAEKAGLRAGDFIMAVDGSETAVVSSEKAADLLKGEEGSIVSVAIRNQSGQQVIKVTRQNVDVPCVERAAIVDRDAGIAYFRLSSFQKSTSTDVDATLWKLHREGMRSLIVDVRGNPGGLLTAAVEVADKFVEEGSIVSTHGRSERENFDYKAHRVGTWRVPLVVLVDADTASASEIFAGAIRDHRRGTVVGQRTYGKGSVQGIFPLGTSQGGIRLTTAKFHSPSGTAISNNGVKPHWNVQTVARPTESGEFVSDPTGDNVAAKEDPVFSAAIEAARRMAVAAR